MNKAEVIGWRIVLSLSFWVRSVPGSRKHLDSKNSFHSVSGDWAMVYFVSSECSVCTCQAAILQHACVDLTNSWTLSFSVWMLQKWPRRYSFLWKCFCCEVSPQNGMTEKLSGLIYVPGHLCQGPWIHPSLTLSCEGMSQDGNGWFQKLFSQGCDCDKPLYNAKSSVFIC